MMAVPVQVLSALAGVRRLPGGRRLMPHPIPGLRVWSRPTHRRLTEG